MKTITQKEEQHAAACCSEPKNRYICISEESEGSYPDTLFETLPIREKHLGKRTLMTNINGGTCLVVEGMGLEIIDDSDWKKPDAVRKEISRQCLKFFTERGIEPHYANCLIRYKDNYDTVEVRIAIGMDAETEKDDDIFFYCDTLEDMKSLAEIGCEDFYIADCYGFGVYEDLL